jgi:hypothetical protein
VTHTYAKGGFYVVTVTADDGKGGSCSVASDTAYVRVNTVLLWPTRARTRSAAWTKLSSFDGTASTLTPTAHALTYKWSFGDGSDGRQREGLAHVQPRTALTRSCSPSMTARTRLAASRSSGFNAKVNVKPVPVIEVQVSICSERC